MDLEVVDFYWEETVPLEVDLEVEFYWEEMVALEVMDCFSVEKVALVSSLET